MKRTFLFLALSSLFIQCSSGRTALRYGDYDRAVEKAANRYRQKPSHKWAFSVLKEAFSLAYAEHQLTIQQITRSTEPFRWEKAIPTYQTLQKLTDLAHTCNDCQEWLTAYPTSYSEKLKQVSELAAAERFEAAEAAYPYHKEDRLAARDAYFHYLRANELVTGFRDAQEKASTVEPFAVLRVVIEPLHPSPEIDREEGRQIQSLLFKNLERDKAPSKLVRLYPPDERAGDGFPIHQVVQMVITDYRPVREYITSTQQTVYSNESYVVGKKKINDSTWVEVKEKVKGELTIYQKELKTSLDLGIRAVDNANGKVVWEDKAWATRRWTTTWEEFSGDSRALNGHSLVTAELPPPRWWFFDWLADDVAGEARSKIRKHYRNDQ